MEDLGERPTLDLVSAAFASRSMATQSPPEAAAEKLLKYLGKSWLRPVTEVDSTLEKTNR